MQHTNENVVKEATYVNGQSLKFYSLVSLKIHKRSTIVWIANVCFQIDSITYKVSMFKSWCKSKVLLHV
jgi:hypothetical protein